MQQNTKHQMEERAVEYFRRGYNCAESVIRATSDVYDADDVFLDARLGSGFGGGMGDGQGPCGALSGGVLAIGALMGRANRHGSDKAARRAARDYARRFEAELGHRTCKDLLRRHRSQVLFRKCGWITGRAAAVLAGVLADHGVYPDPLH